MRIGLFGGSFNPPHIGHIRLMLESIEILKLDKILLIPNFISPLKKSNLDVNYRIKMLQLISSIYKKIEIFDFEIYRKEFSYSIFTLEKLNQLYPLDMLIWLIGDDAFANLDKWKDWERLFQYCNFAIFQRQETTYSYLVKKICKLYITDNLNQNNGQIIEIKNWNQINISSSSIRNRILNNLNCDYLLDKQVLEFILNNNFYSN